MSMLSNILSKNKFYAVIWTDSRYYSRALIVLAVARVSYAMRALLQTHCSAGVYECAHTGGHSAFQRTCYPANCFDFL